MVVGSELWKLVSTLLIPPSIQFASPTVTNVLLFSNFIVLSAVFQGLRLVIDYIPSLLCSSQVGCSENSPPCCPKGTQWPAD